MIPFPRELRVVPIVPFDVGPAPLAGDDPGAVVEHDGRIYDSLDCYESWPPISCGRSSARLPGQPRSFGTKPCGAGPR